MIVIYDKTISNRELVDVLLDGYDVSYLDVRTCVGTTAFT